MKFFLSAFLIFSALGIFTLGVLAVPNVSYAQVSSIEQKITELQAKIALLQRELQQALKELEGLLVDDQQEKASKITEAEAALKKQTEPASYCYKFKSPYLMLGLQDAKGDVAGNEVSKLQEILARDASLYPEGKITGVFDIATKQAVGRFQAKYKLVGSGARGYGIFGKQTIAFMNSLCAKEEVKKPVQSADIPEKVNNLATKPEEVTPKESKLPTGQAKEENAPQIEKNWVKVQFPNGGEEFFVGRGYTISWTSSQAERVNIGVADEKGVAQVLARDVMSSGGGSAIGGNEGKYLWSIPPHFTSGDYKIRIAIPDITNLAIDESDSTFKIRTKDIDVMSPAEQNIWFRGNTYDVLWQSTGIQSVRVDIIDQNGDAKSLSLGVPGQKFSWKVPFDWPLGQYKIRLTDVSSDALLKPDSAESDGYVSVQRPLLPITIINPHDATNRVQVAKGQKGVEFLRFNIQGDEDITLREFTLDDGRSGIVSSMFENFTLQARGDLPIALRSLDYDKQTGRRILILDSPWKLSARNLPLSVRADIKTLDFTSLKEFTVSITAIEGEGAVSQNPVKPQGSATGTIMYNPKQ